MSNDAYEIIKKTWISLLWRDPPLYFPLLVFSGANLFKPRRNAARVATVCFCMYLAYESALIVANFIMPAILFPFLAIISSICDGTPGLIFTA